VSDAPIAARIDGVAGSSLPLLDRGLQYGDGLFETMRVVQGRIPLLDRHFARLAEGCLRLAIPVPPHAVLEAEVAELAALPGVGVVKIIVTRGDGARGYAPRHGTTRRIVLALPYRAWPQAWHRDGIAVRWCQTRLGCNPRLAGLKHLNRLEQVLARGEFDDSNVQEGLLADSDDRLVGGTCTNVFARFGHAFCTPALDRAGIAGVVRGWVLEAEGMGASMEVREIGRERLAEADEVFVCNALRGIVPVIRLAGPEHTWPVGVLTRALQMRLAAAGIGHEVGA